MADDTNWEAQLDWSKIDPVGGIGFYSFIKGSVLKSMDEGLGQLVGIKEEKERKLGSWDEIARSRSGLTTISTGSSTRKSSRTRSAGLTSGGA